MINFFISLAAILVGVGLIVGIHELGHFLLAKWLKVKVLRFSIGFGKPVCKRLYKGTEYVIAVVPLGGYVRLLDEREGKVLESDKHLAFNRQAIWKRLLIIFAGPIFNLLLAWLIYWFVSVMGIYLITPKIGAIIPGSIAERAGLKPFVQIVQMDNQKVSTWGALIALLAMKYDSVDQVKLSVIAPSQTIPTQHVLNLEHWTIDDLRPSLTRSLGIIEYKPISLAKDAVYYKVPPIEAIGKALQQVIFNVEFNVIILWKILTGALSIKSLSGPIGIFGGFFLALKQGILAYSLFLAWISINLAIINLLPIPGLDGSHLVYTIYEGIFKKPVSVRVQVLAYRLGIIFLVFLLTQTVVNDLLRLSK